MPSSSAGAPGDDQCAGLELIAGAARTVRRDADIVTAAELRDEREHGFPTEAVIGAAHRAHADHGEEGVEPRAILARADQRVGRPALPEATDDLGGEEKPVVPENDGHRFVPLGDVGQISGGHLETQ